MKKIISNNMNALKALAIILVVIYHLPVQTGVYVLDSIKGVLYCGVDVFIGDYLGALASASGEQLNVG